MSDDTLMRPWRAEDLGDLLVAVQDEMVARQLALAPDDHDAAREVLERRVALVGPRTYAFAIVLDDRAVGEIGLSSVEPRHRTGWLSYWLAEDVRGRGLATRAVVTVVDWAFAELDVFRIELGCRVNNPASAAVARRAGFRPEGIERGRLEYDGVRYDVERYARLVTDPAPGVQAIRLDVAPTR